MAGWDFRTCGWCAVSKMSTAHSTAHCQLYIQTCSSRYIARTAVRDQYAFTTSAPGRTTFSAPRGGYHVGRQKEPTESTTTRSDADPAHALHLFPTAKSGLILVALVVAAGVTFAITAQDPALTGFTDERADWHAVCERRFLELPRGDSFREHLRTITEHPHPAGSEAQARVGEYIAGAVERAGLDVTNHPYDVYLPELTDGRRGPYRHPCRHAAVQP